MDESATAYLRHVMDTKGWTIAELARAARVAHSTIARPLNDPWHKSKLSRDTLAKVHKASGIDPSQFSAAISLPDSHPVAPVPGDAPFRVTVDGKHVEVQARVDADSLPALISYLHAIADLMAR